MDVREQPRGNNDRARTSLCVRFDDGRGFKCRFNKTGLKSPKKKNLFAYFIKRYEQGCRGGDGSAVLTKFEMFRDVSRRFSPLMPLPDEFQLLDEQEKKETVMKLVDAQVEAAAVIVDADVDMEGDEGSVAAPGYENIVTTAHPRDESPLQNVGPRSVLSEGSPGVPPGVPLDLGCCPRNQLDNPEGRPPPSSGQHPDELNQSMSEIERRASRYPDILPEFEWLKQQVILLVEKLEDRELNEALWLDPRSSLSRSRLKEIPSRLQEGIPAEDPQNLLSIALMEDVGYQASYFQASDFGEDVQYGVKNIATTMPDGHQDGLLPTRSISEALEVVPRFTGRLKTNIADIRPPVDVDNMDGDLQYQRKKIMEGVSQGSLLQVSDLWGGGENFTLMLNSGGNDTSQIAAIDCLVSAEPSAVEQEQWAEGQLNQFDMPTRESSPWRHLWASPVRHELYCSIDTLPA